jgi:4'-phosphopantetheinyl transferase
MAQLCCPVLRPGSLMAANPIHAAAACGWLAPDEVHVWRIPLDAPGAPMHDAAQLLTPTEQARAARFTQAEDRCRFQTARAATRCILGRYLGLPPAQVAIVVDRRGKPRLDASTIPVDRLLQFNISHAGSWILAAFARSFAVGIDVECLRAKGVTEELIGYCLSANERRTLATLPIEKQIAAFFKCWTSKEAWLKGLGLGLTAPLQAIEVSIDPDQPAQLLTAPPELCPGDWCLSTLAFSAPYAATLAVAAKSAVVVDISVDSWRNIN